jgi:hypothetical protein
MQPLTYASVALVFFSWLTIAWTGALVEVMVGGLLGGICGAVVGALFGAGDAIATFCGWIVLAIVIFFCTYLLNIVHTAKGLPNKKISKILLWDGRPRPSGGLGRLLGCPPHSYG